MPNWKEMLWIPLAWGTAVTCVIALIGGKGVLVRSSIVLIVLLGGLTLSLGMYGVGWLNSLRAVKLIVGWVLMLGVGWFVWPTLQTEVASTPPRLTTSPPPPTVPIVKTREPTLPPKVKIDQRGNGNGAVGGSINQGPCSVTQIGGTSNQTSLNCTPTEPPPQRTRGLLLGREMFEFLSSRSRNAPSLAQNQIAAAQYEQETLPLFLKAFGPKLADIRDEFAQYGLSDKLIDVAADPAEHSTASEKGIRKIAETVNKLSLWLPVEEPYKNMSNAAIADLALQEAQDISERAERAFRRVRMAPDHLVANSEQFQFWSEYKRCCLDVVRDLHGICVKRLGPPVDGDEAREFEDLMETMTDIAKGQGSTSHVSRYAPYLAQLGERLKHKTSAVRIKAGVTFAAGLTSSDS